MNTGIKAPTENNICMQGEIGSHTEQTKTMFSTCWEARLRRLEARKKMREERRNKKYI